MRRAVFCLCLLAALLWQPGVPARDDRNPPFRPPKDWKGEIAYEEVVNSKGTKASALVERARKWCAKAFPGSRTEEGESEDPVIWLSCGGRVLEAWRKGGSEDSQTVAFTVKVEAIDGTARITVSDFFLDHPLPNMKKNGETGIGAVRMEECLDGEGFPLDNATERFIIKVHERIKELLEAGEKALSG